MDIFDDGGLGGPCPISRLPPSIEIAVAVLIAAAASSFAGCGGDSNAPGTPADAAGSGSTVGDGGTAVDGSVDASAPDAEMGGASAAGRGGTGGSASAGTGGAGGGGAGGVAGDAGSAGDGAVDASRDPYTCPAVSEFGIEVLSAFWSNGTIMISFRPKDAEVAMHVVLQDATSVFGIQTLINQQDSPMLVTVQTDMWPVTVVLTLSLWCEGNPGVELYPIGIRLAPRFTHMGNVDYAVVPVEPDAGM